MRRSKIADPAAMQLVRVEIEDFALVARGEVAFDAGFTVFTGETGSGKTMLLDALGFVLGDRSSGDVVRGGAARARVTLAVAGAPSLHAWLAANGFDAEPGEDVLLGREMTATGKSTARINGALATTAQLREAAALLVERVGQHEQQRLLSAAYQQDVLDAFAGRAALDARARVRAAYESAGALARDLAALTGDLGRAAAELEFARFALGEIDAAAPVPGEDERLRERRDYLANRERIATAIAAAHDALAADGAALEALGAAAAQLAAVARFSPELDALAGMLAALQSDASDATVALARALDDGDAGASELETTLARLETLDRLKRKYGGSLEAIDDARAAFAATIARETSRDEREAELRAAQAGAHDALARACAELSALRAGAARALEANVVGELRELAMPAARFSVAFEQYAQPGPRGAEGVAFALAPNPGEPERPLARAASGGELARVMLALVVAVAGRRDPTALVFDEIDAGIGGATAGAVGVRLGRLARSAQVVCVTHLAQIAAWADRHYALRKYDDGGATRIDIVPLDDAPATLDEIARMLSGSAAAVALEHARTLVRDARAGKQRIA